MPRTSTRPPLLKRVPRPLGGDRTGGRRQVARDLVHGRGAGWTEEQDHAALGQTRHAPRSPKDQRTASAYIFGAICPAAGKGAGLVLPRCTTEGMELHLKEIALVVAPGAHAAVLLDRAGWHVSTKLVVPDNITLVPLPPRSPELNPVENVWQFLRENWISNRVFSSYTDILDHCCAAWNRLTDQPWRIMSLGLHDWAHGF